MDNQHKMIKGYRDLSQKEIDLMNMIKEVGGKVGELVDELGAQNEMQYEAKYIDGRWLNIGKTHLQQGFMALVRAVAKPESF